MQLQVIIMVLITIVLAGAVQLLPHASRAAEADDDPLPTVVVPPTPTMTVPPTPPPIDGNCRIASALIPVQYIDNGILADIPKHRIKFDTTQTSDSTANALTCALDDPYGVHAVTLRPTDAPADTMVPYIPVAPVVRAQESLDKEEPKSFTDYESLFGKVDDVAVTAMRMHRVAGDNDVRMPRVQHASDGLGVTPRASPSKVSSNLDTPTQDGSHDAEVSRSGGIGDAFATFEWSVPILLLISVIATIVAAVCTNARRADSRVNNASAMMLCCGGISILVALRVFERDAEVLIDRDHTRQSDDAVPSTFDVASTLVGPNSEQSAETVAVTSDVVSNVEYASLSKRGNKFGET